jgi:hypothetical protein
MPVPPSPHELASAESPTYTVGMDPAAIDALTRDLEPSQRVHFWSTFESTVDIPHPAMATGREVDDVAAVFAGSKPAAILLSEDLDNPLVTRLFDDEQERYRSLTAAGARDYYDYQRWFLGQEENVRALVELYRERGGDDSPRPADESFHRGVGHALGYSPAAIEAYIAQPPGPQ